MASLNHISSLTFILLLVLCLHYSCARKLLPDDDLTREKDPELSSKPESKSKLSESESHDPNEVSIQGGIVVYPSYPPGCQSHACRERYPPICEDCGEIIYTPPYEPICVPCQPWYGEGPCPCPCEEGAAADMEGIKTESDDKANEQGEMTLLSGRGDKMQDGAASDSSISRTADAPMPMDSSNVLA